MNLAREYRGLTRIVSGGQTGVDRAALDAAQAVGLPRGGWCPRGRIAEDGVISSQYPLRESHSADYAVRTAQNVVDSEGTLLLVRGEISGGTKLTLELAQRHRRPVLIVDLDQPRPLDEIRHWLAEQRISVLNVAGPRESSSPGIAATAQHFLEELFAGAAADLNVE